MVRRTVVAMAATAALVAALAGQVVAAPLHIHCLETPTGKVHPIARGVTFQGGHDVPAFHNFHGNVHQGAFNMNPLQLEGFTSLVCPAELP